MNAHALRLGSLILMPSIAAGALSSVATRQFTNEIDAFLGREMAAHVADIGTLNPPQPRVVGALTTGEFSWGTFLRAAAVYSQLSGDMAVAGRDLPKFLGQVGLIEAQGGGKAFAQMYAALGLRRFGTDLKANLLWRSLTSQEQADWRSLLDPARFYDRATRHVINLPENYFGVAARVVTMDYQMGLVTDRTYVDDLLDQAARQFVKGAIYSDDAIPTGRFDRYSQEYARYVYEAAENAGRKDILAALELSLKTQLRLWWDLMSPDGYGYPWGRSLGLISYMDTIEIVGFAAEHPAFRPAPLSQLASAYYQAWNSLMREYLPDRHLLDVFGFGHGHYSYINPDREWQQTTAFFGKAANAEILFKRAMLAENISSFPGEIELPPVARFEYFRKGDRPAGVWLMRQGGLRFALPITTGAKPGVADYLAAPHGLSGFSAPVEQNVPSLVPYIELADGQVLAACDGADEIRPGQDGRSLEVKWKRWAVIGGKPGQLVDPGLVSDVHWSIAGGSLVREETISAPGHKLIRRIRVIFPSTSDRVSTRFENGDRTDRFDSLEVTVLGPLEASLRATGNGPLGRGNQGPIPLLIEWEARDLTVSPGSPFHWTLRARPLEPNAKKWRSTP
jgi:hypothetical protein